MPLIYITGPSGAGKSTIRSELTKLGYEAYDTDEDGMSAWYDIRSKQTVTRPDKADRPADWYEHHEFQLSADRVAELAERAKTATLFLCGIPSNDVDFLDSFDKVICLVIDAEVMQQRVTARTTNTFGQAPEELQLMLYWHGKMLERYRRIGATMIDASQPLETVRQQIIDHCRQDGLLL